MCVEEAARAVLTRAIRVAPAQLQTFGEERGTALAAAEPKRAALPEFAPKKQKQRIKE